MEAACAGPETHGRGHALRLVATHEGLEATHQTAQGIPKMAITCLGPAEFEEFLRKLTAGSEALCELGGVKFQIVARVG